MLTDATKAYHGMQAGSGIPFLLNLLNL
jgi:hypothetical protein